MNPKYLFVTIVLLLMTGTVIAYQFFDRPLRIYLAELRLPRLSENDVRAEEAKLLEINRKRENPNNSNHARVVGRHNGRIVEISYICFGDVCPDNGGYFLIYRDIESREECSQIGGKEILGYGWTTTYGGCGIKLNN
ncbi:MAG TPA: hypothetical protein VEC17_01980 [Candidatus Binatia bacterium]|nr:hypothetical protein [Candidatus Binatia bacterium]